MSSSDKDLLTKQYTRRFETELPGRDAVWKILGRTFFQKFVSSESTVLDLGCGYGSFINNICVHKRYAMDLNPKSKSYLDTNVEFIEQDCAEAWKLHPESLDVIFTSNFFEHLPTKNHLQSVLANCREALRPGGLLICMGPNIKYVGGAYWDFWDHYIPLTEKSLSEVLELLGFETVESFARFLPYSMSGRTISQFHLTALKVYLKVPILWRIFGQQFLVIARKKIT